MSATPESKVRFKVGISETLTIASFERKSLKLLLLLGAKGLNIIDIFPLPSPAGT